MDGKRTYLWRGRIDDHTREVPGKLFCLCEFYPKNAERMAGVRVTVSTGSEDWRGEGNTGSMATGAHKKGNLVLALRRLLEGQDEGNISVKCDLGSRGLEMLMDNIRVGWIELKNAERGAYLEAVMRDWLAERKALKDEEEKLAHVMENLNKLTKEVQELVDRSRAEDKHMINNLRILLREKKRKEQEVTTAGI